MVMEAMVSMKQPTMRRKIFTRRRINHGRLVMDSTTSAMLSVIFVVVIRYPKIEAPATMRRMMAVVSAVSMLTLMNARRDSVRYTNIPKTMA